MEIINQISAGIFDQSRVVAIPDRRKAIETVLGNAGKNEIVLVAGKGHETYQEIANRRIFFSDQDIVRRFRMPEIRRVAE